ncbi:MAG: YhcH/YjgK/YiaL family protein [Candidatus Omnitrophica bacterium]|nr:YhcH/YjgK/YiaL family protein [Candidatus Omnitrophota bacterium]MDE2009684.1 YhcH/YjgK/YiaL family protein [Candidatus Omnitrophota bacterium]MDE2213919.1 YhcH/YjgK/YiaL family protein [Candidatus Omnitrophota bacterium]MDE2231931.1 YhcH/YjgK/YiaL family protein [Candidatus Omnitrophota bacterium]
MIFDSISQLKRYAVPCSEAILKFIAGHECSLLPDGEIEIQGHKLFVRIMSYVPKAAAENRFETHRIHADVQYVVSGSEIMQTAGLKDLAPLTDYDAQGDYQFFKPAGAVNEFVVGTGEFAVFYPNEPHRPSCSCEDHQGPVKKLVFKVRI